MLETNSLRFKEYINGSTAQQLSPDVFFFAYGVWYSTVLVFVLVWVCFVPAFVLIVLIFLVTAFVSVISTLPETNIAPENRPLEKEIPIGNHHL